MSGHRLYTPEVLAAAVSLAQFPLTDDFALRGEARSKTCGSRIEVGLLLDADDRVARIGLAARACAIGQASAAIFAQGATGRTADDLRSAQSAMIAWLAGAGPAPAWPGIELIAPAVAFPARHGAMILPWVAAREALADRAISVR